MSILDNIKKAGDIFSAMTPKEQQKEAFVAGRLYEAFYYAAMKDIIKASKFLKGNEAPVIKFAKLAYTTALPFSATLMENVKELIHEYKEEFDNKNSEPEPVMADDESSQEPATNPQQVTPEQAVTTAEIASGTVRRGVILSRSRNEQNL